MSTLYEQMIAVPRAAVSFPLELPLPPGFVADDPETWPATEGQLELVGGKLYFMPPSADRQQDTTMDVATVLGLWRRSHRDFVVGTNEAGMILGGEARGADAAVWRKADLGEYQGRFRRVPPILAVEVQGEVETISQLLDKARWYLARGVEVVWLVLPTERRVTVLSANGEQSFGLGELLPAHPSLPELAPAVDELLAQIRDR